MRIQQDNWGKPDSCTCEKINDLYIAYEQNTSSFEDFSDYIEQTLHTSISNAALDSLRGLCNGLVNCNYLATPITIPPALQCGVVNPCITCPEFQAAYDSFLFRYPSILPTMEEPDSLQQLKNRIFANYLNTIFGFSESAQGYLAFQEQCKNTVSPNTPLIDSSFTCTNFENLITRFRNAYSAFLASTPKPDIFDSSGCNIKNWNINDGGWGPLPEKYRWIDFLNDGIVRQPYNDTLNRSIDYNYLAGPEYCIDSTFTVEVRVRFPRDSARREIFIRNGGNGNLYGMVSFDINFKFQKIQLNSHYKIHPNTIPNYIQAKYYNPGPAYPGNISQKFMDSALLIDYTDWRVVKFKFAPGHDTIFVDGEPIKAYLNPYPLYSFQALSIKPTGYDIEIDWVKLYDKDSLKLFEDFEDCEWSPHTFDTSCNYDCQKLFVDFVNNYLDTNFTYNDIQDELRKCEIWSDPCAYAGPLLCGKSDPINVSVDIQPKPCSDTTELATSAAMQLYQISRDSLINEFNEAYVKKCLNVAGLESFTVTKPVSEYHYTLYYYDQAGNLVKTVPPAGVKPKRDPSWLEQVRQKRQEGEFEVPEHTLVTVYRYNSLNQVVSQKSPDGGRSEFWYDRLGRLAVSQNAKQRAVWKYSYTRYDAIGRITEVAEKYQPTVMTQATARHAVNLKKWMEYGNNKTLFQPKMVTRTYYDVVSNLSTIYDGGLSDFTQNSYTLRNRVSSVRYNNAFSWNATVVNGDSVFTCVDIYVNTAIEYSYDIHGNVDSMLNIAAIGSPLNYHGDDRFKLIAYNYDLISGKVNEVHYQPGKNDEFYHRYEYDADNRLTDVYTADHKAFLCQQGLEEHEASYEYYKHGPLARTIMGQQQVQGLDYAYTIQGWLKGVNSTSLNTDHDMGGDGKIAGTNSMVARDAYGFNLNYFTGEYAAINTTVSPFPGHTAYMPVGSYKPLYNGNISSMAVNIGQFNQPQLYNYGYDQLNRIVAMDVFRGLNETTNSWSSLTSTNDYQERIKYDGNGNILKYKRNGVSTTSLTMDNLTYSYYDGTNQLRRVRDTIGSSSSHNGNYSVDIDDQANSTNYEYDEIGNLVEDDQANINEITWNVYGKITSIEKSPSVTGDAITINYLYDPNGNRVGKEVWRYGAPPIFTWYVRDAQGNVMAVYEKNQYPMSAGPLKLKEHHIYGSSRLGIIQRDLDMDSSKVNPINEDLIGETYVYQHQRGERSYELSNHLGNVLVILSDKHYGVDADADDNYDYYTADVLNANDYYPFGML